MELLRASGLSVRFGGLHAVRGVDLEVSDGQIVGLIGPNGAGKTTTFNALCGLQRCDGEVYLAGKDVSAAPPHVRSRLGLSRTFQRLEVFGTMTALENVQAALDLRTPWTRAGSRAARRQAEEILERVGMASHAHERAESLPTGQARLVELGRALATNPSVLLLDEPASGLDEQETEGLAALLGELAADGMGILLVEHDVELVMRLCASVLVLNFGEVLAVGTPGEIQRDEAVREAYLGAMA